MKNPTVIFVLRKTISILIKYVIKIYIKKNIAKNWISKLSTDIPMKNLILTITKLDFKFD